MIPFWSDWWPDAFGTSLALQLSELPNSSFFPGISCNLCDCKRNKEGIKFLGFLNNEKVIVSSKWFSKNDHMIRLLCDNFSKNFPYLIGKFNLAKSLGPDAVNAVRYAVVSLHTSTSVDTIVSPNDNVESLAINTLQRIISQ